MTSNLRLIFPTVLIFSSLYAGDVHADVSGNIGATTNYLWRGVSQSNGEPAVSVGIDVSSDEGFYGGLWGSNVDFGSGSGTELDFFVGYSADIQNITYDVGISLYTYPEKGFEDSNFTEAYVNITYADFTFGFANTITSDIEDEAPFGKGDIYLYASYSAVLADDIGLTFTVGRYQFDVNENVYSDVDYSFIQTDFSSGDFTLSLTKASQNSGDDTPNIVLSWVAAW